MFKIIQSSYRVAGVTLALLGLFQTSAMASIYKWRDDRGKLHFTDDQSKIPTKYRENIQKFKGVHEPKPKVEAPPEEAQGELESGQEPSAEAQPAPPVQKKPDPNALTPEEKALMTKVHQSLMAVRNGHLRLIIDAEVTEQNLQYYVRAAQSSATQKNAIQEAIGDSEQPLLKKIKSFLKKSAKRDARLKANSNGLMQRVVTFNKRLRREFPMERKLINKLSKKLELEAPPIPPLKEELKRAAERKEQVRKSRRR